MRLITVKFGRCYCSGTICTCPRDALDVAQEILPVDRESMVPKLLAKPYVPPPWHAMKQPPHKPRR